MVINGCLYHATSARGLHVLGPGEWTPDNWDLIDTHPAPSEAAKVRRMWRLYAGAGYDWFSLLAFVGLRVRDSGRLYCFEWCWMCITGEIPKFRVTPEMLLSLTHKAQSHARD